LLPNRVEGRGDATIHDVTQTSKREVLEPRDSPKAPELATQHLSLNQALQRANTQLDALRNYLGQVNAQYTSVQQFRDTLDLYEEEAEKLQHRMTEIQSKLGQVEKAQREEEQLNPRVPNRVVYGASIGIFVPEAATLEIILTYGTPPVFLPRKIRYSEPYLAVYNATWFALYDVRVSMSKTNKPVELIYKAAIRQSTGESWDDVPITLETANPTENATVPTLDPWRVSVYTPEWRPTSVRSPSRTYVRSRGRSRSRSRSPRYSRRRARSMSLSGDEFIEPSRMQVTTTSVVSQGHTTATFRVPGRTTIPSDGEVHSVTIAKLNLDAVLEWVTVPKKDARVHLKVRYSSVNRVVYH
jgi:Domain of unknown function (DUF4139)